MAPQFVDFNADGFIDIVTATFDGSPWVAFGSKEGFNQPKHILDKDGKRIILSEFWDNEARKWTEKDKTGGASPKAHCVSAVAFDWNGNGVFDLILGEYGKGLFVQMNEGTNAEPKFTGVSKPILVDGKPFDAGDKITAPRLVDWDGDGLVDIVYGTFGDAWGDEAGGGVFWLRNIGEKGKPAFSKPQQLIAPSRKDSHGPARPDAALYVDVVDINGNGRLDLVVGGYSVWRSDGTGRPNRKPYIWVYLQAEDKPTPEVER
jgi:hypothetical protein